MAEEVENLPHDYQVNPSVLRELKQSSEEVGRPSRLKDGEEDLRNPGRAREAAAEEGRDVSRSERIEERVEITQDAFDQNQVAERNRAGNQTKEVRQVIDQQEADQQESIQAQAVAERRVASEDALQRNRKERNQIDNPEEAAAVTNNLDSNPTSQARDARNESRNANNDVVDAPEQQNFQLQQRVEPDNAEVRGTEEVEVQENNLSEIGANVPEARSEQSAEDARKAARNEPPLDIPDGNVGQIDEIREPLQAAQATNPLRGPRPSEIRDEPDATAIETERGQNVSSLI